MKQAMTIEGRKRVSREEITKVQGKASGKAITVRRVRTGALTAANVLVSLFVLLSLLYAVSAAFIPPGELFTMEVNLVLGQSTWGNYRQALVKIPLVWFVCNSFITTGLTTVGQITSCSLAAFSFSFLEFKGKNVLFMLVVATMMILGEATIISNCLTASRWNWLDFYRVPVVLYLTSAMGIFLSRQFYKLFPISLYKSAKIDGCGNLRFIFRILLLLTKSVIGTMAMYTFIDAWNTHMWPLPVAGPNEMRTVQIGTGMLNSVDAQFITSMITGVIMIILPFISIFILGQKQLIRGVFSGAVKGQEHPERDYRSK